MHNPDSKLNAAEQARQRAEDDVQTTAHVEGAAAAQYESERRDTTDTAAATRAAQEAKASAEGKHDDKDRSRNRADRPGSFTG
jgi:hypothetical protein